MARNLSDLMINGDPATQLLQELFALDITLARIRCGTCDSTSGLGSLTAQGNPSEALVRCSVCESELIRASRTRDGLLFELRGTRYIRF